jgi:hypothetical protein
VRDLIKKSFAFVPTAGMRLAPEVLVLELMRELFVGTAHGASGGTRELDPEATLPNHVFSDREKAVMLALRGRRKQTKGTREGSFYAPAYPALAEFGWLGKRRERVVRNFLLSGPLAQYLWYRGYESEEGKSRHERLAQALFVALSGANSCANGVHGADILAATLGEDAHSLDRDSILQTIKDKTRNPIDDDLEGTVRDPVFRGIDDALAGRIAGDLLALCDVEAELPRLQWIQLLMTFLRFALPIWLLAQMRITVLLHGWVLEAMDDGKVPDPAAILESVARRNRGLLNPTLAPTRELFERTETYMKKRVELNILLYALEHVNPAEFSGRALALQAGGANVMGIEELLMIARNTAAAVHQWDRFQNVSDGGTARAFATREGEAFSAWREPLSYGQGKNIDEFFRVLYRAEVGDAAGGYLMSAVGRGASRGFMVFPGQLLLKTVTYLAAAAKKAARGRGGSGILALQDVEDHFAIYGIDFSIAAAARPLMMEQLQAMGLLSGSPDAGSSVAVRSPF